MRTQFSSNNKNDLKGHERSNKALLTKFIYQLIMKRRL